MVRGCRVGTEVDEEQGGEEGARRKTAGHCARTPGTGRHTQTHSRVHTMTRPCTQGACFCPPPHRLALASRKAAPSPVQSWVPKPINYPPIFLNCISPDLLDRASPLLSLASLWTKLKSQGPRSQLQASAADHHKQRTSYTTLWTKGSRESPEYFI